MSVLTYDHSHPGEWAQPNVWKSPPDSPKWGAIPQEDPLSLQNQWNFTTGVVESIKKVVHDHMTVEESISVIAIYSTPSKNEFLFIEVNKEAIPTGAVEPFYFAPSNDFNWPIYLADVTRDEWVNILNKEIDLPQEWVSKPLFIFKRDEVIGQ